jgi:hypothetical protein
MQTLNSRPAIVYEFEFYCQQGKLEFELVLVSYDEDDGVFEEIKPFGPKSPLEVNLMFSLAANISSFNENDFNACSLEWIYDTFDAL